MLSGATQLADWMKRRGFNLEDAAEFFDWDPTYISKLLNGHRQPGRENAIELEDKAGIPIRSWSESDLDETKQPVTATARKSKRTR